MHATCRMSCQWARTSRFYSKVISLKIYLPVNVKNDIFCLYYINNLEKNMNSVNNASNSRSQIQLSHHVARKPSTRFSFVKACALGTILFPLVVDALKKFSEPYQCTQVIKSEKYEEENRYIGSCVDNLEDGTQKIFHGEGRVKLANGNVYTGNWEYGLLNGKRIEYYQDGTTIESRWENQELHGLSVKKTLDGYRIDSYWRQGKQHGPEVILTPDGDRFENSWENGIKSDKSTVVMPDGTKMEESWKDGFRYGQMTVSYPNGTKIVSHWENGFLNGWAIQYSPEGKIEEQNFFRNGKPIAISMACHYGNRIFGDFISRYFC